MIPHSGACLSQEDYAYPILTLDYTCRDDPDLDETTRLRNRIAELESLVRELRGMLFFLYDAQIEA